MNYKDYNDFELISYIRESSEEANEIIFEKYKPLIVSLATKMVNYSPNLGLEINDLIQEGMIGLSTAINAFNENDETSFYTYAKTCIERKIISTMIAAKRQKHKILNESMSIELYTDDNNTSIIDALVVDNSYNPENVIFQTENELKLIEEIRKELTPLEEQVFDLKISGFKYREIADILDKELKVIDNALNRLKTKVKNILQQNSKDA